MLIKMVTIYWFYLKVLFGSTCICMQVVLSLDSTKVTQWSQWEYHFRFVLSLSAKLYTKYVLLE